MPATISMKSFTPLDFEALFERGSLLTLLENAISNTIKRVEKSLVMVVGLRDGESCSSIALGESIISGLATGFAIDKHVVVTAVHAIMGASKVCIASLEGDLSEAPVMGLDERWDTAFLHSSLNIQYLPRSEPRIGMPVLACGMAFGSLSPYYSLGIIGGSLAAVKLWDRVVEGLLKSDAVVVPGMSGGPLVNLRGEAVGMLIAHSRDGIALAYAVPIKRIESSYRILRSRGRVVRPRIGIKVMSLRRWGDSQLRGLMVIGVEYGSPAYRCGIEVGDMVMQINGKDLVSVEDLWDAVDRAIIENVEHIELVFYSRSRRRIELCYIDLAI